LQHSLDLFNISCIGSIMQQINGRLKATILRTLGIDDWDITPETLAYEVPGWDSLSHVNVICDVEREFGVRFKPSEVIQLASVGDLEQLVEKKIAAS
jgi:acyl carrier protein